ncbi:MAG: TSUP family transporter [Clostridia bacterium]|nr:TSUP family transporter [Clostridia bacterium]
MMIVWYLVAGFFSGVFGGLGMGGGTLLIPILTIFFNFNQKLSQGINLMSFLVMALFSLFIHYKNGYIVTKKLHFIIISGIIFSCVGSLIISVIPSNVLKIIFGVFLCILSVIEFIKVFKK